MRRFISFISPRFFVAAATAVALVTTTLPASAAGDADAAHTLKVPLDWVAWGGEAPFFLPVVKGWYKAAGLDVTIEQGTGSTTTVQLVGAGQADVGEAALANMAFARSKGVPVTSVAAFFRKGDTALTVPSDSAIKSPADLKGKTVLYTAASIETPFLDPFLAAGHLTRNDVQLTNVDASAKIATYVRGGAEGTFTSAAYSLALVNARRPSRIVLFADWGLNLPGFGLITTPTVLQAKADAVKKFASIVAGSWAYILAGHQEEAIQALLQTHPQDRLDPDQMREQLKDSLLFLYTKNTEHDPVGIQSAADWQEAIKVMEDAKVINPGSHPSDYFTNQYLDLDTIKSIAAGK
jgi:NitT/TauT family transport system substrate-binding protein